MVGWRAAPPPLPYSLPPTHPLHLATAAGVASRPSLYIYGPIRPLPPKAWAYNPPQKTSPNQPTLPTFE